MINVLLSINNFDEKWCYDILKDIIKEDAKVLIVPLSYHENWLSDENDWDKAFNNEYGTHYEDIIRPFLFYGIEENNIVWINQFVDSIEIMKEKIKESNIVFFTGGYPDKMYDRFKLYDLINEFENYNGVMMGMSAGALVQINEYHITPDHDYSTFGYYKGLNIINDFDIDVHYTNSEKQNVCLLKAIREKKKPVYSITDNGALLVKDGKITVMGDVEIWEVFNNEIIL